MFINMHFCNFIPIPLANLAMSALHALQATFTDINAHVNTYMVLHNSSPSLF